MHLREVEKHSFDQAAERGKVKEFDGIRAVVDQNGYVVFSQVTDRAGQVRYYRHTWSA